MIGGQFDHSVTLPGEMMPMTLPSCLAGEAVAAGLAHGAGVEAGDLVVGLVGGDVGSGGELAFHHADALKGQAKSAQALGIGGEVLAGAAEDERLFAQQGQVVIALDGGEIAIGAKRSAFTLVSSIQ